MAELTCTQQEIDELTELLGSLAANISESKRSLLMAIFATGVNAVEQAQEGEPEAPQEPAGGENAPQVEDLAAPDARQLSERLRQSFKPDRPAPPPPLVIRVSP